MNIERRVTAAFFLRLEKCVTVRRIIYDLILRIICGESYVELSGRYPKFVYKFDNATECRACPIENRYKSTVYMYGLSKIKFLLSKVIRERNNVKLRTNKVSCGYILIIFAANFKDKLKKITHYVSKIRII